MSIGSLEYSARKESHLEAVSTGTLKDCPKESCLEAVPIKQWMLAPTYVICWIQSEFFERDVAEVLKRLSQQQRIQLAIQTTVVVHIGAVEGVIHLSCVAVISLGYSCRLQRRKEGLDVGKLFAALQRLDTLEVPERKG